MVTGECRAPRDIASVAEIEKALLFEEVDDAERQGRVVGGGNEDSSRAVTQGEEGRNREAQLVDEPGPEQFGVKGGATLAQHNLDVSVPELPQGGGKVDGAVPPQ